MGLGEVEDEAPTNFHPLLTELFFCFTFVYVEYEEFFPQGADQNSFVNI